MIHPYADHRYTCSLSSDVEIVRLESLGIWVERFKHSDADAVDLLSLYPFSILPEVIPSGDLKSELVSLGAASLVLVTDALEPEPVFDEALFAVARTYKPHHIVDFRRSDQEFSTHHLREIKRARRFCETREILLKDCLDEWLQLYSSLLRRHHGEVTRRFSRPHFETLADTQAATVIGSFVQDRLISAHIWIEAGQRIYSHLAASSDEGYNCCAAYAVMAHSIGHFSDRHLMDLGGAPDSQSPSGGLGYFKSGFANTRRHNMILGMIGDESAYTDRCQAAGIDPSDQSYFPAYRGQL